TRLDTTCQARSARRQRRFRPRSTACTRCSHSQVPARTAATTLCWRGSSASPERPSMRPPVDRERLHELARRLGALARTPTTVYVTGGATAVREGWRASTVDVDVRFEPDTDDLLRELPELKESLGTTVELASPPDLTP